SLVSNSLNSLLFGKNFPKFYQKQYINGGTSRLLARGLQGTGSLEYANNRNLVNNTTFSFKKDDEFTSNNPFSPLVETPLFPNYQALTANLLLSYNIKQDYITRPDGTFYQESKYPRIDLS